MNTAPYYQQVLQQEFSNRVTRNPHYSMRAYAKALETDIGSFSQILSGKRRLSYKKACEFLDKLNIGPDEKENFLFSVAKEHLNSGNKNISKELKKILSNSRSRDYKLRVSLSIDNYRTIADWYHFAIMELSLTDQFKDDPRWIAKILGITISQAQLGIERLLRLGFLKRGFDNRFVKSTEKLISSNRQTTHQALRNRIKQILNKSIDAVDESDLNERHHATMTVPIAKSKIPEAKRRIDQFLNELADFLEADQREEVYEIHMGMFSLQKRMENE